MSKRNLSIQTPSTDHLLSQREPKILKLIHVPNLNRNDSVVHIIPKEKKKYSLKLLCEEIHFIANTCYGNNIHVQ